MPRNETSNTLEHLPMKLPQIVLALSLSICFASIAHSQETDPNLSQRLTNKEIVEMVTAGLSSELIIAKIKVSRCNFDTDPTQLSELKSKGVSNEVLHAMIEAPYGLP